MSDLLLTISRVKKIYNGNSVLNGCSFVFENSKVHTIIGPNGSGKSTLLRICALLEKPDVGAVVYHDGHKNFNDSIELRRKITLVLPKGGLFNMSVFKNAAYGLKIRKNNRHEIKEKVEAALNNVGLFDKRNQNALTLSTGEGQRLALARAMVLKPEVLFLDEPTASLDPSSTSTIEDIITDIKKKQRPTIIMVTHNMFQAQRLADRILFMYEGQIIDEGLSSEFFENPKDERAFNFITGKMVY